MGTLDNPDPHAPDGMTVKRTAKLRTKYKAVKPKIIGRILDDLASQSSKPSDMKALFEIMKNLEETLNIHAEKVPAEGREADGYKSSRSIKHAMSRLSNTVTKEEEKDAE